MTTRQELRDALLEVIEPPARSNHVPDWPEDEQYFYRNYTCGSFGEREEKLRELRREKAVDDVVSVIAPVLDDAHFPWSYTEFGVLCACGAPCRPDESCTSQQAEAVPEDVHAVLRRAYEWSPEQLYHALARSFRIYRRDDSVV